MKVALCMIVKDEERTIGGCLDSVAGICDEIVVVDTGSTDRTREILEQRYGIVPIVHPIMNSEYMGLAAARNLAFDSARSPWTLVLDADERLSPRTVGCIRALPESGGPAGYFLAWNTYRGESVVEDYKLALFRKGFHSTGFMHENIQIIVRDAGQQAVWLAGAEIIHLPEPQKDPLRCGHPTRLEQAIEKEPDWYRYYWFLGYQLLRMGEIAAAIGHLETAARSRSHRFPVECLNSMMLLAEVHARQGDRAALRRQLREASSFLAEVATDFEVRINHRLPAWLESAMMLEAEGRLDEIRAYHFAC